MNNINKIKFLVLGSGVGGLAIGGDLKSKGEENFLIIDRCDTLPLNLHNGVHYLHSNDFGIPFPFELKKISATEEIWNPRTNIFKMEANLPEMISYSMKVMGLRHPSSIMDPNNRSWDVYLPISYNMNDLIQSYYQYIGKEHFLFGENLVAIDTKHKIVTFNSTKYEGAIYYEYDYLISTIPLNILHSICGLQTDNEFKHQTVYITNYKTQNIVSNWLIGIYISDAKFPPYRITILNNIISMESIIPLTTIDEHIIKYHLEEYFDYDLQTKDTYEWTTGRIFGISQMEREKIIERFMDKNIFLLGRFGLWNGKLLMDSTIVQAHNIVNYVKSVEPINKLEFITQMSI